MANNTTKRPQIVGNFIRKRREELGLSQRALGLQFNPPVTTQFISNLERGVTPLPPAHIPNLTKALNVTEEEILALLENEYTLKLTNLLGHSQGSPLAGSDISKTGSQTVNLTIAAPDFSFISNLYHAFKHADKNTKDAFVSVCENILSLPKPDVSQESLG